MDATRTLLLAASQNRWLRERASRYAFVKRSVSRFMPGETLDDAISAAHELKKKNIASVLTHLGENILDKQEAENVVTHYQRVLERIHAEDFGTEISVKLTQLAKRFERGLRRECASLARPGTPAGPFDEHGSKRVRKCDPRSLQAASRGIPQRRNLFAGVPAQDSGRY
jgi:proline dehydrogenase